MRKFRELISDSSFNNPLTDSSVSVSFKENTLHLRFDSHDTLVKASYEGRANPWLNAVCSLSIGKKLNELLAWNNLDQEFESDPGYWDFKQEFEDDIFLEPFELFKAALNHYRGRDYLYVEQSALICRCFGIRENDVLTHLREESDPTLETLGAMTKAGMGCRSCVPQLNRWLAINQAGQTKRYYKEKSYADWLLEIDFMLSCFPESLEWKMSVESFKGNQVVISFDKKVTQAEEETVAKKLQDFLGTALDPDLGFFLRRSRHF